MLYYIFVSACSVHRWSFNWFSAAMGAVLHKQNATATYKVIWLLGKCVYFTWFILLDALPKWQRRSKKLTQPKILGKIMAFARALLVSELWPCGWRWQNICCVSGSLKWNAKRCCSISGGWIWFVDGSGNDGNRLHRRRRLALILSLLSSTYERAVVLFDCWMRHRRHEYKSSRLATAYREVIDQL